LFNRPRQRKPDSGDPDPFAHSLIRSFVCEQLPSVEPQRLIALELTREEAERAAADSVFLLSTGETLLNSHLRHQVHKVAPPCHG
jgi:hypothetical protein